MWVDTHCHLNDKRFSDDLLSVIQRASADQVLQMLVVGIDVETSRQVLKLASEHEGLFAVVGIQPNSLDRLAPGDWEAIKELAVHPKVVGLGESGLDRYWDFAPIDLQREYFHKHLELCRESGLPIVIHCREAEADVVEVLQSFVERTGETIRGVMHSFAGDQPTAEACVECGLHISFSGMVTFKKNEALREVARQVPEDRLLIETDAPYLAPTPKRGKRNEPTFVRHVGNCLAEVREVPADQLAQITTQNARRLFRLPTI